MSDLVDVAPHRRVWRMRKAWAGIAALAVALPLVVVRVGSDRLLLSPSELHAQAAHGTWRHMFALQGVAATIPLPLWALALVVVSVLGFPYVWLAARSLPDRGYAAARVAGLLLVTLVVWWLASLRLLAFTRLDIAMSVLLVGAGAAAIVTTHREELAEWLRDHWRLVLAGEAVFWTFFLAALYVRWSNPDLWHPLRGGEKPMDFAYLNAV